MNNIDNIKDKIELIYGDLFQHNISNADIIYISNLCFSYDVNRQFGKLIIEQVAPGTIIFCSKQLYIEQIYTTLTADQVWSKNSNILKYII